MELTTVEIVLSIVAYLSVATVHAAMCLSQLHYASLLHNCRQKDVKNVSKKMARDAIKRLKLSIIWPVLIVLSPLRVYRAAKWYKTIRG